MYYDVDDKFYELQENKVFYLLISGLSYTEIADEFYNRQKYKFIYKVRKIMKELQLQNRRQLAYFAIKNNLVRAERIKEYR